MTAQFTNETLSFKANDAARYGLEEAVLLSILHDAIRYRAINGRDANLWAKIESSRFALLTPFWQLTDVQRLIQNLVNQQAIVVGSPPVTESEALIFRLNTVASSVETAAQQPTATQPQPVASQPSGPFVKSSAMSPNWTPSEDDLRTLTQYGISREFALQQLPEFVNYWREKGTAHSTWGSKFAAQVRRKWRDHQQNAAQAAKNQPIDPNWKPGEEAVEILTKQNQIPLAFLSDCVPEFKLYWRERGDSSSTWDSKFLSHVKRQWDVYRNRITNDPTPRPIPPNWQPSGDVFDMFKLANIDEAFARQLVAEFVLYWHDSKQVHASWNTKFLQHVKHRWAQRLNVGASNQLGESNGTRSTRDISLGEIVSDRGWAE